MGDVVQLGAHSRTEEERQRFEQWAGSMCRTDEASKLLARSRGGEYVNRVAKGAWAAWQARGLMDAEGLIDKDPNNLPFEE